MMDKLCVLLERLRLELTFFLTGLIWDLNYKHGPDVVISEILRAIADRFEPAHECWITVN